MSPRIYVIAALLAALAAILYTGYQFSRSTDLTSVTLGPSAPGSTNLAMVNRRAAGAPVDVGDTITNDGEGVVVETNANAAAVVDEFEVRRQLMARLRGWASTNFDEALAFVQKMEDGDEKTEALEAVCFGLAEKDPALAVEKAEALQLSAPAMENLVQQWAGKDLPASLVWANNQPAGDQRDEVFQRIAFVLSQSDPRNAAALVIEQIPAGSAQNEAIMSVLHQWATRDLVAAVNWVRTFPDSPFRERALQELEGIANYQRELANQ